MLSIFSARKSATAVISWCSQLVIVFVPVVTALYAKKASKICAWACLAVSTVVWLGYVLFDAGGLRAALVKLADDDVSLTCGAVYGFFAGLIAFFVVYFIERLASTLAARR